jgi:replicative DNA helicase
VNETSPWKIIGLDKKRLGAVVGYGCDPAVEFQIEVLAVKDTTFWQAFGELIHPEFFANPEASLFMTLVHAYSETFHNPPDHTAARDLIQHTASIPERDRQALLSHADSVYQTPITNTAYLTKRVQEMARQRAVRAAVVKIAELNERAPGTEEEAAESTDEIAKVMGAALNLASRDVNPVYSTVKDHDQFISWASLYTDTAVPTMLPSLDRALRGGLLAGELGVVQAPPNRGKTLVLTNLATNAMISGHDTLLLSNEDGPVGLGPRICSKLTGVPTDDLKDNTGYVRDTMSKLLPMFRADLKVVYRPPGRTTINDIRALLDRLENTHKFRPKLLVIDYADRLKAPRKRKELWDELVDIYIELRLLAYERKIAIWTASQSNRGGFSKDVIDLDDVAGSFGKNAEADVVMAYCQTKEERDVGEGRLHLAKMRNRAAGKIIHLYVNGATSSIGEVPEDRIGTLVATKNKGKKKGSVHAGPATPTGTP